MNLEKISPLSTPAAYIKELRLTLAKVFENGKPLSRAKAQVNRETEAKELKSETKVTKKTPMMRTFDAATEFVAK